MKNSQLIKRNKIAGGYTKVYPLAYIQGITDGVTGEALVSILQSFNHIYLPFLGTVEDTRMSLPADYRRQGIFITYRSNKGLVTECYKGTTEDLDNDILFVEDINWEVIPDLEYVRSNASKIPNGAILPDHLSPALWELLGSNNTITNLPDEEDLTQDCMILSFKDREYDPESSGLGYKILRRNWVDGVNVLTSDMMNGSHTIYEVRYGFDLKGAVIEIPEKCTLLFKGGSFNNGTIICNGTNIIGINKFEDGGTATYEGTFDKGLVMVISGTVMWYDGAQWRKIETDVEIPTYTARVVKVSSNTTASASASIVGDEIQFSFGLPKGDTGPQGPRGATGLKGDKGDKGDTGIPGDTIISQNFVVYKSTEDSLIRPATPIGGSWDSVNDVFTPPTGWSTDSELTGIVWMSTGLFRSDTENIIGNWTTPIRLTGDPGINGVDGSNVEFIFKLTSTDLEVPSIDSSSDAPSGWTDSPSGISSVYKCEWVSTRKKEEDSWSNWSTPAIWSKWGENGQDGDGVEYIFYRNNGEPVDNPTPDNTTTDEYQEKGEYSNIEYVPEGWTDNPLGVGSLQRYEWVCQRKYRNGVWGSFSDPAVWAKYGEDGFSGLSLRTMYAKSDIGIIPVVVADNINPGSIWGVVFPEYDNSTESVWCIQAYVTYDNKLATTADGASYVGWQGPWMITGSPGIEGTPPNYKVYIYKMANSKPERPTSNSLLPDGWEDYPNTTGQWWQCIGSVNGVTGLVTEWSEVLPVNGQDGIAQDGKKTEFRFAANQSATVAPALNNAVRTPNGWSIQPPTVGNGYYLWMTTATINPDDTLNGTWSTPVRISGEQGTQGPQGNDGPAGPAGPQGPTGIPGVSFEVRYSLGNEAGPIEDGPIEGTVTDDKGSILASTWLSYIPETSEEYPYIWCIQGRKVTDSKGTAYIIWHEAFRLSGVNGLPGEQGSRGQLVYPAGIYQNNLSYTTTDKSAPYVLDTTDGQFYVLNAIMTWKGEEQDNRTPSQDYSENGGKYWLKFEAFEAVYAKIGIIANGLIGSAVFNGDYMFSQEGINPSSDNSTTSNYENFDSDHIYDGTFTPNILFNFKDGSGHLAAGRILFDSAGNARMNNLIINGYFEKDYKFIRPDSSDSMDFSIYEEDSKEYILDFPLEGDGRVPDNVLASGIKIKFADVSSYTPDRRNNKTIEFTIYNATDLPLTIVDSSKYNVNNELFFEYTKIPLPISNIVIYPGHKAEFLAICGSTGKVDRCLLTNSADYNYDFIVEDDTYPSGPNALVSRVKTNYLGTEPISVFSINGNSDPSFYEWVTYSGVYVNDFLGPKVPTSGGRIKHDGTGTYNIKVTKYRANKHYMFVASSKTPGCIITVNPVYKDADSNDGSTVPYLDEINIESYTIKDGALALADANFTIAVYEVLEGYDNQGNLLT